MKGRKEEMVQLLDEFVCTSSYEKWYEKFMSIDWARACFVNKTNKQKQASAKYSSQWLVFSLEAT